MTGRAHWDATYTRSPLDRLGWYEASPALSLEMVERTGVTPDDMVIDVGSGASTFIAALADLGFRRLAAVDISAVALDHLRAMLGDRAAAVTFVEGDVSRPETFAGLQGAALWHDRAALHFLTDPADREGYARAVRATVRPGGWVMLAAFAIGGATHCSNLPVVNYDASMFALLLGEGFDLVEARDHLYINPGGGERPYVYALFRRSGG